MFSYRPPKGSCWGHAIRPRDTLKARQKIHAFFATYFEPVEPETPPSKSFDCDLRWNNSVLPNTDWPEEYLKPGNENWQRCLFVANLGLFWRIMFPRGITIPISPKEPSSYEFLRRFSADAPFKMSPRHFQVVISISKKGYVVCRKPDAE